MLKNLLGPLLALLLALDYLAWLVLVPVAMTAETFGWLNAIIGLMFLTGLASAANGLPTPAVAQVLYETEHPDRR
jgi:hypothetical protein